MGKKRLKDFKWMCERFLWYLKQGLTPRPKLTYGICGKPSTGKSVLNRFHLVEADLRYQQDFEDDKDYEDYDDEVHDWLKDVDGTLLCWVTQYQKICLVPKSRWLRTLEQLKSCEDKKHLLNKLYRLIGKLQSYNYENTEDIPIPEEFKFSCTAKDESTWENSKSNSDEENDQLLISLIEDILGDQDDIAEQLSDLLGLINDMEKVEVALLYTKDCD